MSKSLEALNEIKDYLLELNDILKEFNITIFSCNKQCENCNDEKCRHKIIEKELKKPQVLYNLIKQMRDNVQKDLHKGIVADKIKEVKDEVIGQIAAYNDVLSLMESMFEVEK